METPWFSLLLERSKKPLTNLNPDDLLALLRPKCKQMVTETELRELLKKKKKLSVKYGIDPTGADIHIGNAVPILLLNVLQRAGHEIHFIIGDFTAQIGDPSDRTNARVELNEKEVKKNMKNYVSQISPLIDIKRTKVHKNSSWLGKMKLAEFFRLLSAVSFGEAAQREDFRQRIKSGTGVSMKEANYSSLMAADSLHLSVDIEVGGLDQLLNFMHTRQIMTAMKKVPEVVLTTPMIEGTAGDGRKMSKSFNNYIALGASPDTQFGQIMSIPDKLILSYFISFGDVYDHEVEKLDRYVIQNPLEAKKELGMFIVALLHGEKAAYRAREDFERKFSKKEYKAQDEVVVKTFLPVPLIDALVVAFVNAKRSFAGDFSKTKIRALIHQGGVRRIEGDKQHVLIEESEQVRHGDLIKVGKMNLFRFQKR